MLRAHNTTWSRNWSNMDTTNKSEVLNTGHDTALSEGSVELERHSKRKTRSSNKGVSSDKQSRPCVEGNTMNSTDVGIPDKGQSAALFILNRPLTEEEENIVRTSLSLPRKERHAGMPTAFDRKTGNMNAPYRGRLQPLLTELRKSCIPCQKALLICRKTSQSDTCSNCPKEEDCIFNKSQGGTGSSRNKRIKRGTSGTFSKELADSARSSKNDEIPQYGELENTIAPMGDSIPDARNHVMFQLATNPPREAGTYLEEDELTNDVVQWPRPNENAAVPLRHDHQEITQALVNSMPTLYGRDVLADDVLEELFTHLASVAKQYTLRMRNEAKRIGFLQGKLKQLELNSPQQPLLQALREIFVVPVGVDINDQIRQCQLQIMDYEHLIRAVLAIQIRNIVFRGPSPFEDETAWREELLSSTNSTVTDMIFQSRRIKQSKTKEFQERINRKADGDVMYLNQAMFPIVAGDNGGETNTQGSHVVIATLANQVYTKIGAYSGNWLEIWSGFGAKFDPNIHRLEDNIPWEDHQNLSDRRVLVTLCPGIRREVSNGNWFPCVKAIVVLQETRL